MADRGILDVSPLPSGRLVPYGPAPEQVVELVGGGTGHRGWVLLVHGGFWRAAYDRVHLRPLAAALADQGYAVALLEYARTGMPRGGWPGTFEDVRAGADLALGLAGARPVALVGHSAGGHLAAWLLHQPLSREVAGAVSLAGCLDLSATAHANLDDGAAQALLGGGPAEVPDRYAAADPCLLGPTPAPLVVVHGDEDEQVPVDQAQAWWQRCATPGRDRLELLEGQTHFPLIDPTGTAYPTLLAGLDLLLPPH